MSESSSHSDAPNADMASKSMSSSSNKTGEELQQPLVFTIYRKFSAFLRGKHLGVHETHAAVHLLPDFHFSPVAPAPTRNRVKFLPAYCPLCSLSAVPEPVPLWDPGSRCRSGDDDARLKWTGHMPRVEVVDCTWVGPMGEDRQTGLEQT